MPRFGGFKARLTCRECGLPIPLDAPCRTAHCPSCLSDMEVAASLWVEPLQTFEKQFEELAVDSLVSGTASHQGAQMSYELRRTTPCCEQCGEALPLEGLDDSASSKPQALACSGCGDPASVYGVPDWLGSRCDTAVRIVSTDRLRASDADRASKQGVAVEPAEQAPRPVVMSCPQCAGSLTIDSESERLYRCHFCDSDVYLPDAVWRRLHPIRKVREFFVWFAGKTPAQLAREKEREWQAVKAVRATRDKEAARRKQDKKKAALNADIQRSWPLVILALVSAVIYTTLYVLRWTLPEVIFLGRLAAKGQWVAFAVTTGLVGALLVLPFLRTLRILENETGKMGHKFWTSLLIPLWGLLAGVMLFFPDDRIRKIRKTDPGYPDPGGPFAWVFLAAMAYVYTAVFELFWLLE